MSSARNCGVGNVCDGGGGVLVRRARCGADVDSACRTDMIRRGCAMPHDDDDEDDSKLMEVAIACYGHKTHTFFYKNVW